MLKNVPIDTDFQKLRRRSTTALILTGIAFHTTAADWFISRRRPVRGFYFVDCRSSQIDLKHTYFDKLLNENTYSSPRSLSILKWRLRQADESLNHLKNA
uniref:Uncharacterized protein n=1 Tax=Romanomermis culicivorax TaxID=13658 RepID=A0A915J1B4_ROMCU